MVRLKNVSSKIACPLPFLVQRIAVMGIVPCHPVKNAKLRVPVVTDDQSRSLQRQSFESANGGHQVIPTAFTIACQVSVYRRWKIIPVSQINADADLLKSFELSRASADGIFPQASVIGFIIHHLNKQATDRQVVAFGPLCNRKNEFLKRFCVGAREGICRIRDEVCFIVNLTARSK